MAYDIIWYGIYGIVEYAIAWNGISGSKGCPWLGRPHCSAILPRKWGVHQQQDSKAALGRMRTCCNRKACLSSVKEVKDDIHIFGTDALAALLSPPIPSASQSPPSTWPMASNGSGLQEPRHVGTQDQRSTDTPTRSLQERRKRSLPSSFPWEAIWRISISPGFKEASARRPRYDARTRCLPQEVKATSAVSREGQNRVSLLSHGQKAIACIVGNHHMSRELPSILLVSPNHA